MCIDLEKKLILAEEIRGHCYNKHVDAEMEYLGTTTFNKPTLTTYYLFYCKECESQHKLCQIHNFRFKYKNKWEEIGG